MFKLFVQGKTMSELRENLLLAGNSIVTNNKVTENVTESDDDFYDVETEGFETSEPSNAIVDSRKAVPAFQSFSAPEQEVEEPALPPFGGPIVDIHEKSSVNTSEVDKRGIPWDKRVHSANKSVGVDGAWRRRRGVDEALLQKIEGEYLSKPAPTIRVSDTVTAIPAVPPVPTYAALPIHDSPVTAPKSYDNFPTSDETRPAHSYDTFKAQFIPTLATLITSGKLSQVYVEELRRHFKLQQIWDVSKNDDQCREMFESFCQAGLITKVG